MRSLQILSAILSAIVSSSSSDTPRRIRNPCPMEPVSRPSTCTDACFTLCSTTLIYLSSRLAALHPLFRSTDLSSWNFLSSKQPKTVYVGPFPASSSSFLSAFSRSQRFSSSRLRSSSSTAMIAWFKENIFISSISTISAQDFNSRSR